MGVKKNEETKEQVVETATVEPTVASVGPNKVINPTKAKKLIATKLHNFNGAKPLAWAWNSNQNLILFGPGGYGKSDAAIMFHDFLVEEGALDAKSTPYVMSFGQGMTEERLLGGIDMPKFKDEGEIIYLLKNAFVSHEYVIFEEIWDAFPAVLLILKDILQSGEVRMGSQRLKVKTKMVVACTNRSRDEVVQDDSTEALMQRFHFQKEVNWNSWNKDDFKASFQVAAPKMTTDYEHYADAIAEICANVSVEFKKQAELPVSPRTAGKSLYAVVCNDDIECLTAVHGFEKETKKMKARIVELKKDGVQKKELMAAVVRIKKELLTEVYNTESGLKGLQILKKAYGELPVFLTNIRNANQLMAEDARQLIANDLDELFHGRIKQLLGNPPKGSFSYKIIRAKNFESIAHTVEMRDDWVKSL